MDNRKKTEGNGGYIVHGICMEDLCKITNLNVASRSPSPDSNPRTSRLRNRHAKHQAKAFGDVPNVDMQLQTKTVK